MLSRLSITNYALIRQLEVEFGDGLNILTGETGAGKSILLGAISMLQGNKADYSSILDKSRKCIIEADFILSEKKYKNYFEEMGYDWDIPVTIRRELNPAGKSRAFINDSPVNLSALTDAMDSIMDIHGQHQSHQLNNQEFRLALVDAISKNAELLAKQKEIFNHLKTLEKNLKIQKEKLATALEEYDFNVFQLNEIEELNPESNECEAIKEEINTLTNAEKIAEVLQELVNNIYEGEGSAYQIISEIKRSTSSISEINTPLSELHKRILALASEMKDLYQEGNSIAGDLSFDSERLTLLNERLQKFQRLFLKHRVVDELGLLELAQTYRLAINKTENSDAEVLILEKEVNEYRALLSSSAEKLTTSRLKGLPTLEKKLKELLSLISIKDAEIKFVLSQTTSIGVTGSDHLEILFSSNKGMEPRTLQDVVSGGELSRLMLCVKTILAGNINLPVIIFDEIDSGISGEVANKVGALLQALSKDIQVICITHLPQIAGKGKQHYKVYKKEVAGLMESGIKTLDGDERIYEIAGMMAGKNPSVNALANAKEMLSL